MSMNRAFAFSLLSFLQLNVCAFLQQRLPALSRTQLMLRAQNSFWTGCQPLPNFDVYNLEVTNTIAWRQGADYAEVWLPVGSLPKDEVAVKISRSKLSWENGTVLIELPSPVSVDESSWYIEAEDTPKESSVSRWVVVKLKKSQKYLNWGLILGEKVDKSPQSLQIGLGGSDVTKQLTAQQLGGFQSISKVTGHKVVDVYGRLIDSPDSFCYFLGKVAAKKSSLIDDAVRAQKPLIANHAKTLLPQVFSESSRIDLLYAPGNSEMKVAQNQISLSVLAPSTEPGSDIVTSVADIGFSPETLGSNQIPFKVKRRADGSPIGPPIQANFAAP